MSPSEHPPETENDWDVRAALSMRRGGSGGGGHYGRYVGLLGIAFVIFVTINTALTKPNGVTGIAPGRPLAPFAVPLVTGELQGEANTATSGKVLACNVRGAQILNVCQLDERAPVVLALFVDEGSCAGILSDMQTLVAQFPGVRFAAVSIKGKRSQLRAMVRSRGLTFPVGIDSEGALAILYKVASCPQVTFAYPGGVVQSKALLSHPPLATLRARVSALVVGSRARGWRGAT